MELGLWRLARTGPSRITALRMPSEKALEDLVAADASVLGAPLLVIGRQVPTAFGGFIDLLALDSAGTLHVLELKRDKTPRDVVAQTLDYTSWASGLGHADIGEIYSAYAIKAGLPSTSLEAAFADVFDQALPDELNTEHRMTIMASTQDVTTERIVRFLAEQYGVAINMVFFRYFVDEGREYIARTWLLDDAKVAEESRSTRGRVASKREPWNGRDWYAVFGQGEGNRQWPDARKYGFFSAGGGKRYTQPVRDLKVGQRLWVHVTGRGYVGTGTVAGPATPMVDAVVEVDGQARKLVEMPLAGEYKHRADAGDDAEWLVPIVWDRTLPLEQAVWEKGMFANQAIVCRLSNSFTLDVLSRSPLRLDADQPASATTG